MCDEDCQTGMILSCWESSNSNIVDQIIELNSIIGLELSGLNGPENTLHDIKWQTSFYYTTMYLHRGLHRKHCGPHYSIKSPKYHLSAKWPFEFFF